MAKGDQVLDKLLPQAIERGFIDVKTMLEHFYVEEKLGAATIGDKFDVSAMAIFALLRRFNIPRRLPGSRGQKWKRSMGRFFSR